MIVVKVEMWPLGNEKRAYEMTRAYIANLGGTTLETKGEYGTYKADFMQSVQFNPKKIWKTGAVQRIHRHKRGLWDILYVALRSIGMEERNPNKNEEAHP